MLVELAGSGNHGRGYRGSLEQGKEGGALGKITLGDVPEVPRKSTERPGKHLG